MHILAKTVHIHHPMVGIVPNIKFDIEWSLSYFQLSTIFSGAGPQWLAFCAKALHWAHFKTFSVASNRPAQSLSILWWPRWWIFVSHVLLFLLFQTLAFKHQYFHRATVAALWNFKRRFWQWNHSCKDLHHLMACPQNNYSSRKYLSFCFSTARQWQRLRSSANPFFASVLQPLGPTHIWLHLTLEPSCMWCG